MKTSLTFLFATFLVFLSILLTYYGIEALDNANNQFYSDDHTVIYSFTITFTFIAIILFLLAIFTVSNAVAFYVVFYKYVKIYLNDKRDREIIKHLKDSKYDALYKDLNGTNLYEEKKRIVNEFYKEDRLKKKVKDFFDFLKDNNTLTVTKSSEQN